MFEVCFSDEWAIVSLVKQLQYLRLWHLEDLKQFLEMCEWLELYEYICFVLLSFFMYKYESSKNEAYYLHLLLQNQIAQHQSYGATQIRKKKSTTVIYSQKLKSDHLVSLMTFLCTNFVTF